MQGEAVLFTQSFEFSHRIGTSQEIHIEVQPEPPHVRTRLVTSLMSFESFLRIETSLPHVKVLKFRVGFWIDPPDSGDLSDSVVKFDHVDAAILGRAWI